MYANEVFINAMFVHHYTAPFALRPAKCDSKFVRFPTCVEDTFVHTIGFEYLLAV